LSSSTIKNSRASPSQAESAGIPVQALIPTGLFQIKKCSQFLPATKAERGSVKPYPRALTAGFLKAMA
jgi:hypothetical protein